MKNITDFLTEGLKSGYWHGDDAWILDGSKQKGYTILVGGHNEQDAKKVQRLLKQGRDLGDYDDFVVFADPDEWKEQNS